MIHRHHRIVIHPYNQKKHNVNKKYCMRCYMLIGHASAYGATFIGESALKIKNIASFLSSAGLIISLSTASAYANSYHDHNDHSGNGFTSSNFLGVVADINKAPVLLAKNVSGEFVRSLSSGANIEFENQNIGPLAGNYAVLGKYKNESACIIFTDDLNSKEKYQNITTNEELEPAAIVDKKAMLFLLVSHELSHCMNSTPTNENWRAELNKYLELPRMSGYSYATNILSVAAGEVHSDLTAVLLAASKTGDWTLLSDVVVPLRTMMYDPAHATINALTDITSRIDPKLLEGKSFEDIAALSNELFKNNFMNNTGSLDPNAPGVKNILREWMSSSNEVVTITRSADWYDKDQKSLIIFNANYIRGFAAAILGEDQSKNMETSSFLLALRSVSLEDQIEKATLSKDGIYRGRRADNFIETNANLNYLADAVLNEIDKNPIRKTINFYSDKHKIGQWKEKFSSDESIAKLGDALPHIMENAFASADDPSVAAKIQESEKRARSLINDAMDKDALPIHYGMGRPDMDASPSKTAKHEVKKVESASLER